MTLCARVRARRVCSTVAAAVVNRKGLVLLADAAQQVRQVLQPSEQRPALDRVAQLTATMKQGERAGAGLAQREAERERQGQHRGMRM